MYYTDTPVEICYMLENHPQKDFAYLINILFDW